MAGARWKSTKKAVSDAAGTWSDPVQYSAEDGKPGNDATAYWLVSPVTNIVFNTVGNPTPAAFYRFGQTADRYGSCTSL